MQADFVSFASHQLRTPLTGIKWMLELALAEPEGSSEVRGFVSDSLEASERLIGLVNDPLSISRLEGGRLTGDAGALRSWRADQPGRDPDLHPVAFKQEHGLSFYGLDAEPGARRRAADSTGAAEPGVERDQVHAEGRPHLDCDRAGDAEIRWSVTDNGIGVPEAARRACSKSSSGPTMSPRSRPKARGWASTWSGSSSSARRAHRLRAGEGWRQPLRAAAAARASRRRRAGRRGRRPNHARLT